MHGNFKINIEKTVNAALYILEQVGGRCDFHKLFKILYFADQKHLATYGTPISGDLYVAMKNGPVPSELYDIFKSVRDMPFLAKNYPDFFEIRSSYIVVAKKKPELDTLAESNVECLNQSISENANLSFNELTNKSHKAAWDAAQNDEMSAVEIAREGGASEEVLRYIEMNIENQQIFNLHANVR